MSNNISILSHKSLHKNNRIIIMLLLVKVAYPVATLFWVLPFTRVLSRILRMTVDGGMRPHSITCAGVAVPSAVERKELLQFPVVKEVAH